MWKNKYGAIRTLGNGISFASKLESATYDYLLLLEKAGELRDIKCQHTVHMTRANISWKADFKAFDVKNGYEILIETKGCADSVWLIKLKLYRVYGEYPLWIFKGTYKKLYLHEVVIPDGWKNKKVS